MLLEFLDVCFKQVLLSLTASIPDTAVVDEEALVHALEDAFDFVFENVAVDAAGGDAGIAYGLGFLGDALRVVDLSAVAEDVEDPLELHLCDSVGELANKDAGELLRAAVAGGDDGGGLGLVVGIVELNSFGWIRDKGNVADQGTVEGVVVGVEELFGIRGD